MCFLNLYQLCALPVIVSSEELGDEQLSLSKASCNEKRQEFWFYCEKQILKSLTFSAKMIEVGTITAARVLCAFMARF